MAVVDIQPQAKWQMQHTPRHHRIAVDVFVANLAGCGFREPARQGAIFNRHGATSTLRAENAQLKAKVEGSTKRVEELSLTPAMLVIRLTDATKAKYLQEARENLVALDARFADNGAMAHQPSRRCRKRKGSSGYGTIVNSTKNQMNIAIFGSSKTKDTSFVMRNIEWFDPFCDELGRWIGERGYQLLVQSDSAGTADARVADAVARYGRAAGARVKVFWRAGKAGHSPFSMHPHADVFVEEPVAETLLGATHHRMLREADFCIAIGGGKNTYNAALSAAFTRTRLVPVGTFGGAGRQLIAAKHDLRQGTLVRLPDDESMARLGAPAWRRSVEAVIAELEDYPRLMIVHGRDQDRVIVQDLLRRQGVRTVYILAEQPRLGAAVLEKFQECAMQSDAAVVLFTPDDYAGSRLDVDGVPLASSPELLRARQNVVLEYGWFSGAIGRDRLLLLVKGDVELPSDLAGVLYYQYQNSPEEAMPASALRSLLDRTHHWHGRSQ